LRRIQLVDLILRVKENRTTQIALKGYIEGRRHVERPGGRYDGRKKEC
jgi:hypothetical protein